MDSVERVYLVEDWTGSAFEKFAKNFCYKNQWRVASTLGDYEDCLAYCAMCYVICCDKYGCTVKSAQHMMFMYRLWVEAEFNTMSNKETTDRKLMQNLPKEEASIESDAHLAVKLLDGSSDLKSVLHLFMTAPQEIMEVLRQEASSCHPRQFWKAVLKAAGIKPSRSAGLAEELEKLLSK